MFYAKQWTDDNGKENRELMALKSEIFIFMDYIAN